MHTKRLTLDIKQIGTLDKICTQAPSHKSTLKTKKSFAPKIKKSQANKNIPIRGKGPIGIIHNTRNVHVLTVGGKK